MHTGLHVSYPAARLTGFTAKRRPDSGGALTHVFTACKWHPAHKNAGKRTRARRTFPAPVLGPFPPKPGFPQLKLPSSLGFVSCSRVTPPKIWAAYPTAVYAKPKSLVPIGICAPLRYAALWTGRKNSCIRAAGRRHRYGRTRKSPTRPPHTPPGCGRTAPFHRPAG